MRIVTGHLRCLIMVYLAYISFSSLAEITLFPTQAMANEDTIRKIPVEEAKKVAAALVGNDLQLSLNGYESWGVTAGKGKECYRFIRPEMESLSALLHE